MKKILADDEVSAFLSEPKRLPPDFRTKLRRRRSKNRPHERYARLDVVAESGNRFRIFVKVNTRIANNFSVGIVLYTAHGEKHDLIRCNGWHDEHENKLDTTVIPADTPHIHRLNEAYQRAGWPMGYAEVTTRYEWH